MQYSEDENMSGDTMMRKHCRCHHEIQAGAQVCWCLHAEMPHLSAIEMVLLVCWGPWGATFCWFVGDPGGPLSFGLLGTLWGLFLLVCCGLWGASFFRFAGDPLGPLSFGLLGVYQQHAHRTSDLEANPPMQIGF
jgi:hypothetical protein